MSESNGNNGLRLKTGLAEMLKGGVIMDVTDAQARSRARRRGRDGAGTRAGPDTRRGRRGPYGSTQEIREIMDTVSIPVMAKCRIGHFAEAQILQGVGVDHIDESEVLTPADEAHHVNKHAFTVPFVCGARDLGEALRRISEGAAMIPTKGEAGTGDVVHAVKHLRQIVRDMKQLTDYLMKSFMPRAKDCGPPVSWFAW